VCTIQRERFCGKCYKTIIKILSLRCIVSNKGARGIRKTRRTPEINEKMKTMISDIRKDVYVQLGQKGKEIEPFLSDPVFDLGPKKVEAYEFKLPKLTEELDDASLASYAQLLVSEDPCFSALFDESGDWMNALPKISEKTTTDNI